MSITPLPSAPAVTDTTSEFNTKAFNWVAALDPFTTEANALLATCEDAATTAGAAIALVGSDVWVSGTSYAIGDAVYSPIDMQTYKRKTNGAGTTDPSADSTNWARISLADPANQITAIATGSLTNGATVAINSDGTVSVVSETAEGFGTAAVFESAYTQYISATFDSANNKVVIAYSDVDNSYYGTAIVGTVSGTSISFGTPVIFESAFTYQISSTFHSTNNKVVIAYSDVGNSYHGTVIVGTVSGTSISFGTAVVFEPAAITNSSTGTIYDNSNNKVVIAYRDSENSNFGTAIVGTVSGTSISFGTPAVFESAATTLISSTFDSTNNKVVIAYCDVGNSFYGTAVVGTVSGTSISFGTPVVFESATLGGNTSIDFDSTNNKVIIAYVDAGNSYYGTAIVGTVSGTSISFGTPVVFESAATTYISATYLSSSNKVLISYRDEGNSNFGTSILGTVSGTSISFESPIIFKTSSSRDMTSTFDSINNKVVIAYSDVDNSYYGNAIVYRPYGSNSSQFIGFAESDVLNGQSATVKTIGAVINNQTGLTPASKYYVQVDGSLSTTQNSFTSFAGTAISSTSIIVKG